MKKTITGKTPRKSARPSSRPRFGNSQSETPREGSRARMAPRNTKEITVKTKDTKKPVRLNKLIADSGLCSRRQADQWITAGQVSVNGTMVKTMGLQVNPKTDQIQVNKKPLPVNRPVYLAFHKPKGYLSTKHDDEGRQTIFSLLPPYFQHVDSAGRLDRDTSGLMILSNDGDFIHQITHPSFECNKRYRLSVTNPLTEGAVSQLLSGIMLEPEQKLAKITCIEALRQDTPGEWPYEVTLVTGYYRQIRRSFEAVGHPLLKLKRVAYGSIKIGHLPPGEFRPLKPYEVNALIKPAAGRTHSAKPVSKTNPPTLNQSSAPIIKKAPRRQPSKPIANTPQRPPSAVNNKAVLPPASNRPRFAPGRPDLNDENVGSQAGVSNNLGRKAPLRKNASTRHSGEFLPRQSKPIVKRPTTGGRSWNTSTGSEPERSRSTARNTRSEKYPPRPTKPLQSDETSSSPRPGRPTRATVSGGRPTGRPDNYRTDIASKPASARNVTGDRYVPRKSGPIQADSNSSPARPGGRPASTTRTTAHSNRPSNGRPPVRRPGNAATTGTRPDIVNSRGTVSYPARSGRPLQNGETAARPDSRPGGRKPTVSSASASATERGIRKTGPNNYGRPLKPGVTKSWDKDGDKPVRGRTTTSGRYSDKPKAPFKDRDQAEKGEDFKKTGRPSIKRSSSGSRSHQKWADSPSKAGKPNAKTARTNAAKRVRQSAKPSSGRAKR